MLNRFDILSTSGSAGIGTMAPDHRLTTGAQDKVSFGYDAPLLPATREESCYGKRLPKQGLPVILPAEMHIV